VRSSKRRLGEKEPSTCATIYVTYVIVAGQSL
jgi:hypothetical protein